MRLQRCVGVAVSRETSGGDGRAAESVATSGPPEESSVQSRCTDSGADMQEGGRSDEGGVAL